MLNYLNHPMQIEIEGPSKSGRVVNTCILIFFCMHPKLERCAGKITAYADKLPISLARCLKMKTAAVRLLRMVGMPLPKEELRMVSQEFWGIAVDDYLYSKPLR